MSWLSRNLAKQGATDARKDIHYDTSGTLSYLDAGGTQVVVTMAASTHYLHMRGVWLDTSNLTQNGTFKVEYKIDGTNYQHINSLDAAVTGGTTKGIYIDLNVWTKHDLKVSYTEGGDEGAARDIPYTIIYTAIEI